MNKLSYVTESGEQVSFYDRREIMHQIVQANNFLQCNTKDITTIYDVLNKYKELNEKLQKVTCDERAEDIHLIVVDVYYMYLARKYTRQIKCCQIILDIFSFIYGVDFTNLTKEDLEKTARAKYYYEGIRENCPIKVILYTTSINLSLIVPPGILFLDAFATYMFNKDNNITLSEADYVRLERKVLDQMGKKKNRRN